MADKPKQNMSDKKLLPDVFVSSFNVFFFLPKSRYRCVPYLLLVILKNKTENIQLNSQATFTSNLFTEGKEKGGVINKLKEYTFQPMYY